MNKNGLRPETEKKNYERKWSILYTSSPTKEPIRTRSKKKKIFETLIRSVATYGAEAWTLNKDC